MTIERRARPEPGRRGPVPERGVHVGQHETQPWLDIARLNDNELVLFDRERQESWIVFPPRSRYDFLKRPSPETVLVEHHPWAPFSPIVEHLILPREGCLEHRLDCGAQTAIQAGLDAGWNPFK